MKPILSFLLIFVLACFAIAEDPATKKRKDDRLTPEAAKDALVRLIRANRTTFIGDGDPDKLASVPVKTIGHDQFSFGAFTLDLSHHSYSVVIGGASAPSTVFYNGSFIERAGVWTATLPKVLYGDHLPEMHK